MKPIPHEVNKLSKVVVESSLAVHRKLGPGLLESAYETCLLHEFKKAGIDTERQVKIPIIYDGIRLETQLRLDLWLERKLIVEVKSVESVLPIHRAQVLTYLKMTNTRLGLLINFNVRLIKRGINRIAL